MSAVRRLLAGEQNFGEDDDAGAMRNVHRHDIKMLMLGVALCGTA